MYGDVAVQAIRCEMNNGGQVLIESPNEVLSDLQPTQSTIKQSPALTPIVQNAIKYIAYDAGTNYLITILQFIQHPACRD
jgi:hypothetical protein